MDATRLAIVVAVGLPLAACGDSSPGARADAGQTADARPPADADADADAGADAPDATAPFIGEAAIAFGAASFDAYQDDVIGYRFSVGADAIVVGQLGYYDEGGDGLGTTHQVAIYDATSQAMLVSAEIPAGELATLDDGFRYLAVAPVSLAPDHDYVILTYRATATDRVAYEVSDLMVSPAITWDNNLGLDQAGGLVFTDQQFSASTGWFGPGFKLARP
jgi:hypothetical protein